jgi:phosphopentomutase
MLLEEALDSDARFIFANFEDFDMLYGHRNDPAGFARCLESFDVTLAKILDRLTDDDLLILTSDHGNDPTDVSTDHSREFVPYVEIRRGTGRRVNLGDRPGFAFVGEAVREHLG